MRRTTLLLALGILMGAGTSRPNVAAGDEVGKPASTAVGLVLVETEDGPPLDGAATVWRLLLNSSIQVREALAKVSPAAAKTPDLTSVVAWKMEPGDEGITVQSFREDVPADKLLAALVEVLEGRLNALAQKKREALDARYQQEQRKLQGLEEEYRRADEALRTLATIHKMELNPEVAAQKRLRIETELQSLAVQLEGLQARQAVIENQVARLGSKIAEGLAKDDTVEWLQARIQVTQSALDQFRKADQKLPGTITKSDLARAEAQLLEAQAALPKYFREAAAAAGGTRIAQLQEQLDDDAIEIAENNAKREVLVKQLSDATSRSSQTEMHRIKLELLERDYRRAAEDLSQLRAELQKQAPPRITLIRLE